MKLSSKNNFFFSYYNKDFEGNLEFALSLSFTDCFFFKRLNLLWVQGSLSTDEIFLERSHFWETQNLFKSKFPLFQSWWDSCFERDNVLKCSYYFTFTILWMYSFFFRLLVFDFGVYQFWNPFVVFWGIHNINHQI